jgi:chloramphenicol 3-O-phosphotransferase
MPSTDGRIILLNGTSSTGKSAILSEFKKLCPDYIAFNVDDWFTTATIRMATERGWHADMQMHPWQYLRDYVNEKSAHAHFDIEVREHLFTGIRDYYYTMQEILRQGKNVILDTVLEYEREYTNFDACFQQFNCVRVLVYCPVDVVLERIKIRNSSGVREEQRLKFQLFESFSAIYRLQEHPDEPVVDTIATDTMKTALQQAMQELMMLNIPPAYDARLHAFEETFIQQFKLNELSQINLVARHSYDLILNSAHSSAEELAEQISHYETQKKTSI